MKKFSECTTKKERVACIREKIETDRQWAGRALEVLLSLQDEDERINAVTSKRNGQGFTAFDAEFLTSLAEQYLRKGAKPDSLTDNQWAIAHKKLAKYAAQLERNSKP